MLIYRIQDINGDGLYTGNYSHLNPVSCLNTSRHPIPEDDTLLRGNIQDALEDVRNTFGFIGDFRDFIKESDYVFGFSSREQLRSWIYNDEWVYKLQQRGFDLLVSDVPSELVLRGNTQVIFKKADAIQFEIFKPADFFGISEDDIDPDEHEDYEPQIPKDDE